MTSTNSFAVLRPPAEETESRHFREDMKQLEQKFASNKEEIKSQLNALVEEKKRLEEDIKEKKKRLEEDIKEKNDKKDKLAQSICALKKKIKREEEKQKMEKKKMIEIEIDKLKKEQDNYKQKILKVKKRIEAKYSPKLNKAMEALKTFKTGGDCDESIYAIRTAFEKIFSMGARQINNDLKRSKQTIQKSKKMIALLKETVQKLRQEVNLGMCLLCCNAESCNAERQYLCKNKNCQGQCCATCWVLALTRNQKCPFCCAQYTLEEINCFHGENRHKFELDIKRVTSGTHVVRRWSQKWYNGIVIFKESDSLFIRYEDGDEEHLPINKINSDFVFIYKD